MKKIIVIVIALLFSCQCAQAQQSASPDPYRDWLTYYYVNPDTAPMTDFLKWLQEKGSLEQNASQVPMLEGFTSVVFAANPMQVDGWKHAETFTGNAKKVVDYAAKPNVTPDAKKIQTLDDLNFMWGAYFASGNTRYIDHIIDLLDKSKPFSGDKKDEEAVRDAAAVSLGSNMTEHESVDRFLTQASASRSGSVGDILKHIITNVVQQRATHEFPNRDGEFSAIMFVTDPNVPAVAAKEALSSSANIVRFKQMTQARTGQKRTLLIIFAGMQLNADYSADVTYDIQITNPAGRVYTNISDLEGIKKKVPTRFRVFNNKAAIFIAFDSKDKPGLYKIHVLIKDNIGKKEIPLNANIRFKK